MSLRLGEDINGTLRSISIKQPSPVGYYEFQSYWSAYYWYVGSSQIQLAALGSV